MIHFRAARVHGTFHAISLRVTSSKISSWFLQSDRSPRFFAFLGCVFWGAFGKLWRVTFDVVFLCHEGAFFYYSEFHLGTFFCNCCLVLVTFSSASGLLPWPFSNCNTYKVSRVVEFLVEQSTLSAIRWSSSSTIEHAQHLHDSWQIESLHYGANISNIGNFWRKSTFRCKQMWKKNT